MHAYAFGLTSPCIHSKYVAQAGTWPRKMSEVSFKLKRKFFSFYALLGVSNLALLWVSNLKNHPINVPMPLRGRKFLRQISDMDLRLSFLMNNRVFRTLALFEDSIGNDLLQDSI